MARFTVFFMLLFLFFQCFCNAQEVVGSGIDCNETGFCNENTSCIDNYHDLELYVKGNKEVIEELKDAFFYTGEAPSKFVRLLYKLKVSNDVNDSYELTENCSNHTSKYIWSDSALYLLGPQTLAWFTFFTVDVPEISITIELPCLCNDDYDSLLSRLTYMIKVYAAMEYHDQPLQFISNHFFQVKSKADAKYNTIVIMIKALTYLPLTLMPFISCLTIIYISPLISCYVTCYSEINEKDEFFQIKQLPLTDMQTIQTKITKRWKTLHLVCLFLTSLLVNTELLKLHIYSAAKFIEYGNEILHEEEFLFANGPSGYHYLPYMHAKLSYFLIGALHIFAIGYSIISVCRHKKSNFIATSISVNIIYVVCYFFPSMLLAFLHDPLLTIFTCFMLSFGIVCIYSAIWSVGLSLLTNIVKKLIPHTWFSFKIMIYSIIAITIAYSIIFLMVLIDGVIELGSFSDFQALQNDMILPVLVGLLTLFILKPVHKYASNYAKIKLSRAFEDEERNKIISDHKVDEVCITINQEEDSHNKVTQEMDGQNDENTIV